MQKKLDEMKRVTAPWFRKVIAYPNGGVVHYGDCSIYSLSRVCDCGLIKTLQWYISHKPERIYPKFWEDYQMHSQGLYKLERLSLGQDPNIEHQKMTPEEAEKMKAELREVFKRINKKNDN